MDISIIIISWNACRYLDQCLESVIKECSGLDAEIIVVDNASTDGSPEMVQDKYPNVKLLKQKENLGFAKANNLALSVCKGTFLFLINSDVIVKKDCIRKLHSFLIENPSVGMAGPRILGADGLTQRSYMSFLSLWKLFCVSFGLSTLFPKSRFLGGFEMKWMNPEVPCRVDIINGCFWAIRMSAYQLVGGLDERFFMYGEDMDWCKRFSQAGLEKKYYPEAEAIHFGGGSSMNKPKRFFVEMLRANIQYWKKHHGKLQTRVSFLLYFLHNVLRILVNSVLWILKTDQRSNYQFKIERSLAGLSFLLMNNSTIIIESDV